MDDGSENSEETLKMLEMSAESGVTKIVATSHFYANRESPAGFLERRSKAFSRLMQKRGENKAPEILLGAEVRYFEGVGSCDEIKNLSVSGTRLILIEMPTVKWSERMVREVASIESTLGLKPVLAHTERYFIFGVPDILEKISLMNGVIQISAGFLAERKGAKFASMCIDNGIAFALGTDCHNLNNRKPNMGEAISYLNKKLGTEKTEKLIINNQSIYGK